MAMFNYRYEALQHYDSFRILVLHPTPNALDPLTCTILHERLSDDSLKYEAVSYTWGNSGLTHEILCNQPRQRLLIGANCHSALRRLRLTNEDRILWIDAICINQEDLVERARQVCVMRNIYSGASEVMVMLSDTPPECRLLLAGLARARQLDDAEFGPVDLTEERYEELKAPPDRGTVRQLEALFEDPWFKRTWVLQEVYKRTNLTMMYGTAAIEFDELEKLYYGYGGTRVTRVKWPLPLQFIQSGHAGHEYWTLQFTLWNRLHSSRECVATDPRDKVFALKSLLGARQSELDYLVDYAQSVEDCFKRIAGFLLPVVGLRILLAVRHPHSLNMASWIPDWSQNLPLQFFAFNFESEEAMHLWNRTIPAGVDDQERVLRSYSCTGLGIRPRLHVAGYRHAQIVECSEHFVFDNIDDAESQMRQLYNALDHVRQYLDESSKTIFATTTHIFNQKVHGGKR